MSAAAVSSSSIFQELQSFYQSRQTDLKQLGSALQSGNLAGAQQAYTTLATLGQSGPFSNSEPFGKTSRAQDFEAIGTALQAGDLASAQSAFATLKSSFQKPVAAPGQNAPGQATPPYIVNISGTTPDQPTVATNEIIINLFTPTTSSANQPPVTTPVASPIATPATTGVSGNSTATGATGIAEIVINLENGSNSTAGSTAGSTGAIPEIVINIGGAGQGTSGSVPSVAGTSTGTQPPELVINLSAQQNYELILNLFNPSTSAQSQSNAAVGLSVQA